MTDSGKTTPLTQRDWLAGLAMHALLTKRGLDDFAGITVDGSPVEDPGDVDRAVDLAMTAYCVADGMIDSMRADERDAATDSTVKETL